MRRNGFTPETEEEINDLVAFIENSLRDPNLIRYVPDTVNSGNCIPNSDNQSNLDLGCEADEGGGDNGDNGGGNGNGNGRLNL